MGSGNGVLFFRAFGLAVLAATGIFAVFYVTRNGDTVRPTVHPRAATTFVADCQDHLINGLDCSRFPGVCNDSFGREVCQKTCNVCGGATPTTSGQGVCKDHVDDEITCAGVANFCSDRYAHRLCPKYCGFCGASSSSATISQPATTVSSSSSSTTSTTEHCMDHVGNGFQCAYLPGICSNIYGHVICRRHCLDCVSQPGETPSPPSATQPTGSCVDFVMGGYSCKQLPGVCSDTVGPVLCPRFCGTCTSSFTTAPATAAATSSTVATVTSAGPCVDHVIHGRRCGFIPGICENPNGKRVCRRHCGLCTSSTTPSPSGPLPGSGSCVDYVGHGLQCRDLPNVCQDQSQIGPQLLCPKYCGRCYLPTTPSPALTQPPSLDVSCHDHLIHDVLCKDVANACQNIYLRVICPRQCQSCSGQGANVVLQWPPAEPCYDKIGAGLTCGMLPGVCTNQLASAMCQRTCGKCATTTPTTSSATPPSATTTTTATTTITSSATSKSTAATAGTSTGSDSTTGASSGCVDNLGAGLLCSSLASTACSSAFAASMCPKTCNLCGHGASSATTTTTTGASGGFHATCKDNVANGLDCQTLQAGGFCNDTYSNVFCRRTCGHCNDTTTSSTLPTVVSSTLTSDVTKTSDITGTSSSPVCEDRVSSCQDLLKQFPDLCITPNGHTACAKFCGHCHSVSTTATPSVTSTSPPSVSSSSGTCKPRFDNSTCRDEAESAICSIPRFCDNDIAKAICKKTCMFCEDGCVDRLLPPMNCASLYGANKPVASYSELCVHPLGIQECEAHCGCPGFCPIPTTATPTTPPP